MFFNSSNDCTSFYSLAELAIPTETQTNEANTEIETRPVSAEMKVRKY